MIAARFYLASLCMQEATPLTPLSVAESQAEMWKMNEEIGSLLFLVGSAVKKRPTAKVGRF